MFCYHCNEMSPEQKLCLVQVLLLSVSSDYLCKSFRFRCMKTTVRHLLNLFVVRLDKTQKKSVVRLLGKSCTNMLFR